MEDTYYYEVNLLWNTAIQKTLRSSNIGNKVKVDEPTKFPKKIKEKWTAEHLFVAAINSCLMSTFLLVAENLKFQFISFESNAVGIIEKENGKFTLKEIVLKPTLIIPSIRTEAKAKKVLEMSEKAFAIVNSTKTKISLDPIISIE